MKTLRPKTGPWHGFRFWFWKLFHPKKWKRQRELFRNIDEMHHHKVPGLENLIVYSSRAAHMREGHPGYRGRRTG